MKLYLTLALFFGFISLANAQGASDDARILYEEGEYRQAMRAINERELPENLMLLADCYHKLDMLDSALTYYYAAEDAGYDEANLFLHRGICLTTLEITMGAEDDLLRYYTLEPDDKKVHYYLAAVDYIDNNLREALFHLNKAIEIDPRYMEAHYLKAAVYMEQNKMISALETFEHCLDLKPDFTRSKLNIAIAQYEMFHYEAAEELLTEIVQKEEELLAEALFYLGNTKFALHQQEEACEFWKKSELLGDNYAAEQVLQVCVKGTKRMVRRKTTVSF